MYEDLGMAALLAAIAGGMLKIARTATDKIVVEIRLDKTQIQLRSQHLE